MENISVENLTFRYPNAEENALNGISLDVRAGEILLVFGKSGCGKSTLLRHLKPQLAPRGDVFGEISLGGKPLKSLDERESAAMIGFVGQSPESQIVTDKVWHELVFGLENLGLDSGVIRRRAAETASFFGIENLFDKNTFELSGGQKQILNLASVMITQPQILLLDEPTSQLDPIAAADFLSILRKINTELGTTIILAEHRLEETLPMSNRAAFMENGKIAFVGTAVEIGEYLKSRQNGEFRAMPAAMRIWSAVESGEKCPVSVNEGRAFLARFTKNNPPKAVPPKTARYFGEEMISLRGAWFRYKKDLPDVMKNADISARSGEILCVLGGNGTGKTTLLRLLAGIKKPYRGEVSAKGKVLMLPQDPKTLFSEKTVFEELWDAPFEEDLSRAEKESRISEVMERCGLCGLESRHPYDLSGGEMQRAALAKLLLGQPEILLADEPTKGFDAEYKAQFAAILRDLAQNGACILIVSHDIEFCAEFADRCALFFDGAVASCGEPREFFSDNGFYTTSASRISRGIVPNAVLANDVISAIGGKIREPEIPILQNPQTPPKSSPIPQKTKKRLPLWRKIGAAFFGLCAVIVYFFAARTFSLGELLDGNSANALGIGQLRIYGIMTACLILTAIMLGGRQNSPPKTKKRLSKRTVFSLAAIVALIPLTLFIGLYIKQYYIISTAILIECMLPFFVTFEGRKPMARELVIIAVLCALGIAGRAAFFMLPQFKPVLAVVIIAGAAFGGETGFLVGAATMLVSNMMFSQGAWTPWQMFAAGLVGFLAGILCRAGFLRRTRLSLCVFGAVCTLVIYGGIMNFYSALFALGNSLNFRIVLGYFLTGLPMDCIHAAATAVFLWFLAEPIFQKLERVKEKYGLAE